MPAPVRKAMSYAIRDYAKELGLKHPFELDAPVSLALTPAGQLKPVLA